MMFCYFAFVFGHIVCLMLEGTWLGESESSILESLVGFKVTSLGGWEIPKMIGGFFWNGIPMLVSWDYSFLHGTYAIYRFTVLASISVGVIFGITMAFSNAVYSMASKLLSW